MRRGGFPPGNGHTPAATPLAVVGTGYVGLVVGACLARVGHAVTCVDVDAARVAALRQGRMPCYEPRLEEVVREGLTAGCLGFATELEEAVARCEVVFVTVGTPSGEDGAPDLSAVLAVAEGVARAVPRPCTLVLKSTVPVGTTARVQALVDGVARHRVTVVTNPEFLREGSAVHDFLHPARVVVGARRAAEAAPLEALYRSVVGEAPLLVVDPESAELAKYAANALLAARVSFMNEVAALCGAVGADVEAVRRIVGLDPRIGQGYLAAGLGFGGSCLPKDLRALEALGRAVGVPLEVVPALRRVNAAQPARLCSRVLAHFGGSLQGRRLAVWGLAFKPHTDDVREAPALALIRLLLEAGAEVAVYDPRAMDTARAVLGETVRYGADLYAVLEGADALVVATEWPEFRGADLARVRARLARPVVFDGRNCLDPAALRARGLTWYGVGRAGDGVAAPALLPQVG